MHTNKLINESSPYLLEHAHNPVNWYPWGKEALEKAKSENKPLIISIGYAACHWCHVMEHESFSDEEVAKAMNENFVAIKVDREERPDIDSLYMNASLIQNGRGGWPLNAFAMPDGRPFFVGTYFPKESWLGLLGQISHLYQNDYNHLDEGADNLNNGVASMTLVQIQNDKKEKIAEYGNLYSKINSSLDHKNGGLTGVPKFPMPSIWDFLMQYSFLNKEKSAGEFANFTLEKMALSGTYDQLGGGFHRYATDMEWKVPHFEKMLYDNAQLISTYSNAYKVSKNPIFKDVVYKTVDFLERELTDESGGFYSSLNADSEGEEGKFYVWDYDEVINCLTEDEFGFIRSYYQLSKDGNWEEGKNIFHSKISLESFALGQDIDLTRACELLSSAKAKLFDVRSKRIRPSLDDKVITAWNVLALSGLLEAYKSFGEEKFLDLAMKNANFIKSVMINEGGELYRIYKDGKVSISGFLDDYSLTAKAFLDLYQVTFDKQWLDLAQSLTEIINLNFKDENSNFYFYAHNESNELTAKTMEISDNVLPASNSVVAHLLFDLGYILYKEDYIEQSKNMLSAISKNLDESPTYYCNWALLLGKIEKGIYEVAIVGKGAKDYVKQLGKEYLPNCLYLGGEEENLPLLKGKFSTTTTIYVCKDKVCNLPTSDVREAMELVGN